MTAEKRGDRCGATEFGCYSGLTPQPLGCFTHVLIVDEHDPFDCLSDDRQVQFIAAARRQGDRSGVEVRQLDEMSCSNAFVEGRRAFGLHTDNAGAGL